MKKRNPIIEEAILEIVDVEMRPIIKDLREAGLETFTCCQSGPGHSFDRPIVRLKSKHSKKQILGILKTQGYNGFELLEASNPAGVRQFWEIEFYSNEPKPGVILTNAESYLASCKVADLQYLIYGLLHEYELDKHT